MIESQFKVNTNKAKMKYFYKNFNLEKLSVTSVADEQSKSISYLNIDIHHHHSHADTNPDNMQSPVENNTRNILGQLN